MEEDIQKNSSGLSINFWIIISSLVVIFITIFLVIISGNNEINIATDSKDLVINKDKAIDNGDELLLDREGESIKTEIEPMVPQSVQDRNDEINELSENTINIDVSHNGFNPNQFEVNSDKLIAIQLTSTDSSYHRFRFRNELLKNVAFTVGPGKTESFTFETPIEPGEYSFYCSSPGHAARGEVGKMIVQ